MGKRKIVRQGLLVSLESDGPHMGLEDITQCALSHACFHKLLF